MVPSSYVLISIIVGIIMVVIIATDEYNSISSSQQARSQQPLTALKSANSSSSPVHLLLPLLPLMTRHLLMLLTLHGNCGQCQSSTLLK